MEFVCEYCNKVITTATKIVDKTHFVHVSCYDKFIEAKELGEVDIESD